jgi:hypothetical protein
MASTTAASVPTADATRADTVVDPERWIIPIVLAATTSIVIGGIWDVSWHMTIGRDSLWSPPHLLEQLGAAIAGSVCGAYVLWLTFRAPAALRARTVRFWSFNGPLGAWVVIWGALAMIMSVPFDNWWHGAYGLDVQILSPPHSVLMIGVLAIQLGTLIFTLAARNRAPAHAPRMLHQRAYTYATGVLVMMAALALYEIIGYANSWHRGEFYIITAALFPFLLVGVARAGAPARWPATAAAATYMGIMIATMWILQLVPAQPKLAPIYNPLTRMVPLAFPLILIAPALAIDLLQHRFGTAHTWRHALSVAAAFVLIMILVHWPFAGFMLSPDARNFIFAADQWPYMYRPGEWRYVFWEPDVSARLALEILFALGIGTLSARVGIAWGNFTRRLLR